MLEGCTHGRLLGGVIIKAWLDLVFQSLRNSTHSVITYLALFFGGVFSYFAVINEWFVSIQLSVALGLVPVVLIVMILTIRDLALKLSSISASDYPISMAYERIHAQSETVFDRHGAATTVGSFKIRVKDGEISSVVHKLSALRLPLGLKDFQIDLVSSSYDRGDVVLEKPLMIKTKSAVRWRILFVPPARRDEVITYSYRYTYPNAIRLSYEEILKEIQRGTRQSGLDFNTHEFRIVVRTHRLVISYLLPEDLEITDLGCEALVGDTPDETLTETLRKSNCFSVEKRLNRWYLRLEVDEPHMGLSYRVKWRPPRVK